MKYSDNKSDKREYKQKLSRRAKKDFKKDFRRLKNKTDIERRKERLQKLEDDDEFLNSAVDSE